MGRFSPSSRPIGQAGPGPLDALANAFAGFMQGRELKKQDEQAEKERAWEQIVREITMQDQGIVREEDVGGELLPAGTRPPIQLPPGVTPFNPDGFDPRRGTIERPRGGPMGPDPRVAPMPAPPPMQAPMSMAPAPGAFDPITGSFAPVMPQFRKLGDTGFYRDMNQTPEARKERAAMQERERIARSYEALGADPRQARALPDAPELADNLLFPTERAERQVPIGEQIAARVQQLVGQGMELRKANEQARLEFGESVGAGGQGASDARLFTQSTRLMSAFNSDPTVKDATTTAQSYATVRAASQDPSAAGDLSLIFAYMKMLDPGSTVREGEFANAEMAAGVPERIVNLYNRVRTGERLNPTQRDDFIRQAEKIAISRQRAMGSVIQRYSSIAQRNGVDPRDVVFDPFDVLDMQQSGGATGNINLQGGSPPPKEGGYRPTNPYRK